MEESKKMARIAYSALEDKKGENIKVIKVRDITIVADYFIIANGTNASQVSSMVDHVEGCLGKEGFPVKRIEGVKNKSWVLMDYGDLVVHIFSKEDRLFYDLERIWRDGVDVSKDELA
jgi:ribosome-associated protein